MTTKHEQPIPKIYNKEEEDKRTRKELLKKNEWLHEPFALLSRREEVIFEGKRYRFYSCQMGDKHPEKYHLFIKQ